MAITPTEATEVGHRKFLSRVLALEAEVREKLEAESYKGRPVAVAMREYDYDVRAEVAKRYRDAGWAVTDNGTWGCEFMPTKDSLKQEENSC